MGRKGRWVEQWLNHVWSVTDMLSSASLHILLLIPVIAQELGGNEMPVNGQGEVSIVPVHTEPQMGGKSL